MSQSLLNAVQDPTKRSLIIDDCCALLDQEVGDKGGLSGLAVKAGFAAVKGVKPGFIPHVIGELLPEFAAKLDPLWTQAQASSSPSTAFLSERARIADALLAITDAKAQKAKSGIVRGTYEKLRGSAKKHVEDAVPRLSKLLEKHTA